MAGNKAGGFWFAGFSWAAFVFGAVWFLYRRLWKGRRVVLPGGALIGASLSGAPLYLCYLMFRLLIGFGANWYYFSKTRLILAAVRAEALDLVQQLERLKAAGGTSETAVVIAMRANLLLSLASSC